MAVMIVSASMPFSLARASIVCINGFCMSSFSPSFVSPARSELHLEPPTRNQVQREPMQPTVRRLEQHVAVLHSPQPPFERLLVVDRLLDHQLGQPSREALVIAHAP